MTESFVIIKSIFKKLIGSMYHLYTKEEDEQLFK